MRERIPAGYMVFIHVTGESGEGPEKIAFQPGSGIEAAPDEWHVGDSVRGNPVDTVLPRGLPDGVYQIRTGLYAPKTGQRLRVSGTRDETDRILLGTLAITDSGRGIRFTASPPALAEKRQTEHVNAGREVVDFGKVATSGSLLLEKQRAGVWLLTPFPREESFLIILKPAKLDPALHQIRVVALDAAGRSLGPVIVQERPNGGATLRPSPLQLAAHYRVYTR